MKNQTYLVVILYENGQASSLSIAATSKKNALAKASASIDPQFAGYIQSMNASPVGLD